MSHVQENTQRCGTLLENDRELTTQIRNHWRVDKEKRQKLKQLQNQYAALFSRLSLLEAAVSAGRIVGGYSRGKAGAGTGAASAALALIEIPITESQIGEVKILIAISEEGISANRVIIDQYEENQRSGAVEMRTLHCIF